MKRWLWYPAIAIVAIAATAAGVEAALEQHDRSQYPMHGDLVDVGGYRLNLHCTGSGSPTVVLIPGAGETSAIWGWIAPMVATTSRVCVYDRAGRGWSEDAGQPQDGLALASDLHRLLVQAHGVEPIVLVGHSFGGLYARVYASVYPAEVAGVVLLDATHPEMFTRVPGFPGFHAMYARVSSFFPALARLGIGRVFYRSHFDSLPPQGRAEERAFWSTAALASSQHDEWVIAPVVMEQAGRLTSLGSKPLAVVTGLVDVMEGWLPLQREQALLSTNSLHLQVAQSHNALVDTRGGATISAEAIQKVVAAVRTGQPLQEE